MGMLRLSRFTGIFCRLLLPAEGRHFYLIQNAGLKSDPQNKPVENAIKVKLANTFQPCHLEVINESGMHNVPEGSESHFKVVVISDKFEGLSLVQRHRLINKALEDELASQIHALSITTQTSKQWKLFNGEVPKSPPCMGGDVR